MTWSRRPPAPPPTMSPCGTTCESDSMPCRSPTSFGSGTSCSLRACRSSGRWCYRSIPATHMSIGSCGTRTAPIDRRIADTVSFGYQWLLDNSVPNLHDFKTKPWGLAEWGVLDRQNPGGPFEQQFYADAAASVHVFDRLKAYIRTRRAIRTQLTTGSRDRARN